ncbi:hypothetical protein GUJ93_ZPchr0009g588 [Zizania palustris]|uniref:Uncharacterized protein n=1 Tax=Zizania palustris TaxID=103762 RepID=A0A8J5RBQ7_ZIZPA|nr:hypothetical protein GUJ93_ZPchr0009g588 [Zizania palustris]
MRRTSSTRTPRSRPAHITSGASHRTLRAPPVPWHCCVRDEPALLPDQAHTHYCPVTAVQHFGWSSGVLLTRATRKPLDYQSSLRNKSGYNTLSKIKTDGFKRRQKNQFPLEINGTMAERRRTEQQQNNGGNEISGKMMNTVVGRRKHQKVNSGFFFIRRVEKL